MEILTWEPKQAVRAMPTWQMERFSRLPAASPNCLDWITTTGW